METYFIILRNNATHQCSILGTLSADEEVQLTNRIATIRNQGIDCGRVNLSLDKSINEEIANLEGNYTLVPINNLFTNERFIEIQEREHE